ncbi:hypothetical protein ColLi_07866 [Colletotrichum liriopes]|uniref:Uncharacterized protein n=1 Tax=Colletotrichum liriopes TaxID=708192 RepID=A0AA37GRW0_9PEZI|nr:hypothetical protein ColLi_07866 [Colletotrichum liriopes]
MTRRSARLRSRAQRCSVITTLQGASGVERANQSGGLALAGKGKSTNLPHPLRQSTWHFSWVSVMAIAVVGNLLFPTVMGGRLEDRERLRAGGQNGYGGDT